MINKQGRYFPTWEEFQEIKLARDLAVLLAEQEAIARARIWMEFDSAKTLGQHSGFFPISKAKPLLESGVPSRGEREIPLDPETEELVEYWPPGRPLRDPKTRRVLKPKRIEDIERDEKPKRPKDEFEGEKPELDEIDLQSGRDDLDETIEQTDAFHESLTKVKEALREYGESAVTTFEGVGAVASAQIGNVAAGAFDLYADAMDRVMSGQEVSAETMGRALRNMAANSIRAVGQKAMIDGAYEFAKGISAVAVGSPAAAAHFAAAGQFFGVAAAAGVAAGAMSVAPGGRAGGNHHVGSSSRAESNASGGGSRVHFTIVGNLDTESREELLRQLREAAEGRDV